MRIQYCSIIKKTMLKYIFYHRTIIACFLLAATVQSCSFLKEVTALGKCEFRLGTLEQPEIAGIPVNDIGDFADLGLRDAGRIGASLLQGTLPLSFTLNVEARNPNPATAALNRLEYIAFIDDVEIARGALDQRVEIPPNGGDAVIPLRLATDLVEILQKESRNALFNFGLNLADASNKPTRVTLKVKPTILVGMIELQYPGYFNVRHEFSSGD